MSGYIPQNEVEVMAISVAIIIGLVIGMKS
jgi:hypothetical protein